METCKQCNKQVDIEQPKTIIIFLNGEFFCSDECNIKYHNW